MISHILTNNSLTIVLNNKIFTINNTNKNWEPVLSALRESNEEKLDELLNVQDKINEYTLGNIIVRDNEILYKGIPLDNYVKDKVLIFAKNKQYDNCTAPKIFDKHMTTVHRQ